MTKGVKRGLTIGGIFIGVILLLMILIPVLFKGKIKDAVLKTANEKLNAKVEIGDFGLNLFSNFPNATLSLDSASIVGVGDFEKDTLLQAQSASVTIDLFSLFGNNYKVSKINLDKASVFAKILPDGRANWDIVKEDSTSTNAEDSASSVPFKLDLQKVTINSTNVKYEDQQGNMKFVLDGWNGTISGDFSSSETTLKTNSTIEQISFYMTNIPYFNKVRGIAEATLNANLDDMKFTFIDSKLQLNELNASIDGSFGFVGEEGMDFDLKLNTPNTQFKDILSIVPAMYTSDFKDVKTSGTATLSAYVKGLMEGDIYPAFDVKILIADAMFQYPSLPKSVNNINVNIGVTSKGGTLDNTVVDISKFSFNLAGNPFGGSLHISTPMSDPNLKMNAKGNLDLGVIKDVYPLEKGTELNGKITADISIATRMSAIEKEQYDQVSASGHLKLANMIYKSTEMPDVLINDAALEFTPQYVNLSSLDVKIGKNDISANGRLDNFIAYALKNETLKGQLNIKSNYLNANDFISDETSGNSSTEETSSTKDIIIPKNIDFTLNAILNQIVYNKINITNMNGAMVVKDGILSLNNVGANALGGSCKISGYYDTSDPTKPEVNFDLHLSNVSFTQTFQSVESIQKFAPIFENLSGTYSMDLKFNTSLGEYILQTLGALSGNGDIRTSNVKIENVQALKALSSALKTDALNSFSAKDLNIPFSIVDGKVMTKPFNINMGDGGNLKLEGYTSLDETIAYAGEVSLPKSLSNNYVSTVPITIGGTFKNPKIGVDTKSLVTDAITNIAGKASDTPLDDKKEEVNTKLSDEKTKQIQKLRTDADNAAKRLVEEAEKSAQTLEDKAGSNVIAKAAAKKAGEKLVEEANKKAQELRNNAEEQIKKLE